ncbi:U5 snRNP complex subunit protein [Rutstroemia sp. NJR-2017a BBW]|nr:U5 snRNP complex subunit protein [Rutstroemia sp. NJR-2017a BBW]
MPSSQPVDHRHMPSTDSTNRRQSRLDDIREGLHSLFSGRTSIREARSVAPESHKAPRLPGLGALPSTRIVIPGLNSNRSSTRRSFSSTAPVLPQHEDPSLPPPFNSRPASRFSQSTQLPPVSTIPPTVHRRSERRFVGVDPAEQHLADLVDDGRRRRRRKSRSRQKCLPRIRNKKIRQKILLTLVLAIYLALALSDKNETQEFHVLLILIILIITIFFCHSLIRLCMMIINPPAEGDPGRQRLPSMVGPSGYAETSVPIPVALARDEEAAGIESEATKVPPPAYGLWRESVRVDPNRIYWQRNEAPLNRSLSRLSERPSTANRPPSYMSDDGVGYVVEAAPRSTVPGGEDSLPPHPAERSGWSR